MSRSNNNLFNVYNNMKEDNNINIKENKTPEINKKIKFSITRREKSQVVIFNNFDIKDINGRKEIILNKIRVPKNEYNNYYYNNSGNNLYNISSDSNTLKLNKLNGEDEKKK